MAKQELTLEQKQTQRLALEQQRLLGMMLEKNDAEMSEFIDNKVNEIQALEKKADENDEYGDQGSDKETERENSRTPDPEDNAETNGDDDTMAWYRYFANNRSRDDEYYAPTAVSEKTMQEFLTDQLGELELDETQQLIARAIVGNIEDDGYLRRSAAEIADDVTFNDGCVVDAAQVESVLETVQSLDPPGIAARNLRECMMLQLRRKPRSEDVELALSMVEHHFEEMAAMRFDNIGRKLGVDTERLEQVFRHQIRRGLNPNPGNAFESQRRPTLMWSWTRRTAV